MNDATHREHGPRNENVRHERSDVSLRGLLVFLLILGISAVLIHVAVGMLFAFFAGATVDQRRGPALTSAELGPLPAWPVIESLAPESAPRVHPAPAAYAWIDRKANLARIPIEKAKAILAGRLPARGAPPKPLSATEANGGQSRKETQ